MDLGNLQHSLHVLLAQLRIAQPALGYNGMPPPAGCSDEALVCAAAVCRRIRWWLTAPLRPRLRKLTRRAGMCAGLRRRKNLAPVTRVGITCTVSCKATASADADYLGRHGSTLGVAGLAEDSGASHSNRCLSRSSSSVFVLNIVSRRAIIVEPATFVVGQRASAIDLRSQRRFATSSLFH